MKLIIPGTPIAKGRPRLSKWGTYTPEKTVNYETLIKELFIISNQKKLDGALVLVAKAYFPITKSTSKKNRAKMISGEIHHTKKPDYDNISKIIGDALNGLAYDDDSQIVDGRLIKSYSEEPRLEIEITKIAT